MAQIILDSANNLIQGDFDTATLSLRTRMQTSTTNATTGVYVVPNGSATSASVQVSNAADPTNASKVVVATNGATDTQIVSGANGSGSYLPLSFYTNNDIRFQMGNAGELNVRTAPGTVSSGTSGQVLTSGGPGAGVSWATAAGGQLQAQLFTAPGTWTKPASCTQVRVTVVGGGAGGGSVGNGGNGGIGIAMVPVSAPVTITVGAGGSASPATTGASGGTSSFGPAISSTGGGGGTSGPSGANGTSTVSVGTALRTYPSQGEGGQNINSIRVWGQRGPGDIAPNNAATAYTTSLVLGAGGGSEGNPTVASRCGGIGGAIMVEFVG
jgi:hypothetical protein